LRTPLTSVQNVTRILLDRSDGDLTAEQERQVTMIRKAAEGLTDMVNELLDLARIEAGRTTVEPAPFSVVDLFSALRGLIRPIVMAETVTLVIDEAAARSIPQMHTDERRLSQILRNFLSNAVKFTEEGRVTLSASMEADDMVRFTVSDTGIGIAPDDIARVFEDFTQVDSPIQRRVRGSGLGLPLTKKLATLLNGHIDAQSEPGVGSTFSVVIPRIYRAPEPADE
jgi:signal transduction histidine kinase